MRSVVPIQTPHGVLLNMGVIEEVRTPPKSRTFRSTPSAPLHENYSLFAINQEYGDAPARGATMHQP
jgi:hypothetical protein